MIKIHLAYCNVKIPNNKNKVYIKIRKFALYLWK